MVRAHSTSTAMSAAAGVAGQRGREQVNCGREFEERALGSRISSVMSEAANRSVPEDAKRSRAV